MKYTKLKKINQYQSKSINPAKTPNVIFEMYSVPIYETGHPEYLRGQEIASNKIVVVKNDILLCKINPRINRVWVVTDESDNMSIASSEWIVIRNDEYNPEFLAWYFRTPKFQKLMTSEVTGIGGSLTRAQPKCVAEYPVPILCRKKQDEIVAVLNKCKNIIDYRRKELSALDDLIKARFVEMFGDPITNPKGYINLTVAEAIEAGYIEKPFDGNHGSKHPKASEYVESGIPFLMANNVIDGNVDLTNCSFITEERANKLDKGFAKDQDVLVTHKGTIGRTAVLRTDYEFVMLTPQVAAYRVKKGITPDYLCGYFATEFFQKEMRLLATAGGSTRAYAGITAQLQLRLIIPPLDEQKVYTDFINQVNKSKVAVQKALDETQKLFDSLMQQYFG